MAAVNQMAAVQPATSSVPRKNDTWLCRYALDLMGLLWVLAAAVAVLVPALHRGISLGPFDQLSRQGLTSRPGVVIHNPYFGQDQIHVLIPWTNLAWQQVHNGQLPLWNPYSALGMPLAFNWQSGVLSVPNLVGYLLPLRLDYTVQILCTLFIAGVGMYLLGRILRLGVLAAAFAATVFELSGPMMTWLGWPHAVVMSWAGWLFASALLIVNGRRRALAIPLFAVALACAVYAGQLEILTLLGMALGIFIVTLFVMNARSGDFISLRRPIVELCLSTFVGLMLAAPLILPGMQIVGASLRSVGTGPTPNNALPLSYLKDLITPGITPLFNNFSAGAYLGVIVIVLAVVGLWFKRGRPEIIALVVTAIVMAGVVFIPFVVSALRPLPGIGVVLWSRALLPFAFAVAIVAGVGMEVLVRSYRSRRVLYLAGVAFILIGGLLLLTWAVSVPAVHHPNHLLTFPMIEVILGVLVVGGLLIIERYASHLDRQPIRHLADSAGLCAGLALLSCTTIGLVITESSVWASSSTFFAETHATTTLQRDVGASLVGIGCSGSGIVPDVNVAYGVRELAVYDPLTPREYFNAWSRQTGRSAGYPSDYVYCPTLSTAEQARLYGVRFVLEPIGAPAPQGAVFDTKIGDDDLYRIPLAAAATITPSSATGAFPGRRASGTPVHVSMPTPATWRMVTSSTSWQVLRLRLTNVPGWHATVNGKPLELKQFAGVMLQARIPPGRHLIVLSYWPTAFTVGLILATCGVLTLIVTVIWEVKSGRGLRRK